MIMSIVVIMVWVLMIILTAFIVNLTFKLLFDDKNEPTEHPQYANDGKIDGDTDNEA